MYEVIEKSTSAKMSRTYVDKIGPASSTVFTDAGEALDWLRNKGLSGTHEVKPVK